MLSNDTETAPEADIILPSLSGARLLEWAAVAFLLLLFLSISLGTVVRYLGLARFEWSFEVAGVVFIWVTFIGAILAEVRGENVGFEALDARLSGRARPVLAKVRSGLILAATLFLAISASLMAWRTGAAPTPILRVPQGVQYVAVFVGAGGVAITALKRLMRRSKR